MEAEARRMGIILRFESGVRRRRVKGVAQDVAVEKEHVGADLVKAAGFDGEMEERGGVGGGLAGGAWGFADGKDAGEDSINGDGFLALAGDDGFLEGAVGMGVGVGDLDFLEAGLDDALRGRGDAGGEGEVFLVDAAVLEIAAELVVGVWRFGDDEEAGGVFVEAVEEAEVAAGAEVLEEFAEEAIFEGEEAVEKGIGGVALAGLRDEAGGFVDDEEVGVFVKDGNEDGGVGADGEGDRSGGCCFGFGHGRVLPNGLVSGK